MAVGLLEAVTMHPLEARVCRVLIPHVGDWKPIAMDTDALKLIISLIGYLISVMDYWGGRLQQSRC